MSLSLTLLLLLVKNHVFPSRMSPLLNDNHDMLDP